MNFRKIEFGSNEYAQACELRNQILRQPSGLNLYDEDLNAESAQVHFGLFEACGMLVACVIAAPFSVGIAKVRQMAVKNEYQHQGCGLTLIHQMERDLAGCGYTELFMHVRATAVGFYEKAGYTATGTEFIEIGIPHIRMKKIGRVQF